MKLDISSLGNAIVDVQFSIEEDFVSKLEKMSIQKDFWYKIEDSLYDEEEDFRRIRSHVKNEVEEEKYKQLEFDFDLVAPI